MNNKSMLSPLHNYISAILILVLFANWGCTETIHAQEQPDPNPNPWVTAYLATWQHNAGTPYSNWGSLTTDDIDWDAITHLIYFALNIGTDGKPSHSLDPRERRNMNTDRIYSITEVAHQHDTKILFSVGGAGNYKGFSSAIKYGNREQFIATIKEWITVYGFDGVDLDMEPIRRSDYNNYRQFVLELQGELSKIQTQRGEQPMITIAALKGPEVSELYASIQQYVDQINIMTYDMAQAWSSWQAWHNSALFSDGVTFDRTGGEMSSIKQKVDIALNANIERRKLGIGIDFYGYIWHGIHRLGKWENWPAQDLSIMERSGGVPYSELYDRFDLHLASWDSIAQTSYLNAKDPKAFVSFDNERSVQRKIKYAVDEGLGGVILWELGGGFLNERKDGTKDPLLQAVKTAVLDMKKKYRISEQIIKQ
ncbi:glycoside hydrolase family 18 protein [Fodinibius sp. AD559]|uniref:glycoside hydrolase family 18 protein n=1 Tax=Fodinibius sp. AD559 TaxID=3424179 RepID=UPI004046C456